MAINKTILVSGATGRQGGAVARQLLADGWNVRAMTRNPKQPPAMMLQGQGAEIVQGDLNDFDSFVKACEGVYAVFSVQNFWEAGPQREIQQGKNLADAANTLGVRHFVYSSVGGADRKSGLSHFESKWQIELYIASLDLRSTILRPVFFMDNILTDSMRSQIQQGTLQMGLEPNRPLQVIATRDIGVFAGMAFMYPDDWVGYELEIAGDELTGPQMAEAISRIIGKDVQYQYVPTDEIRKSSQENAEMFDWFNKAGYMADIGELRDMNPDLLSFPMWLEQIGKDILLAPVVAEVKH